MSRWFNLSRMSLRQRLTFYTLLLILLPVIIITAVIFFQWSEDIRQSVDDSEVSHLASVRADFDLFLQRAETDIRYLTNSPAVRELATAIKDEDGRAVAVARQLVIDDFLNMISVSEFTIQDVNYPFYYQLRYLDTIKLPADNETYYVSDLALARDTLSGNLVTLDDGSVIPLLHFGMPVYIDGELMGVIVTNIYFQNLFELLSPTNADEGTILLNEDGYFLYNTLHPNQQFGFETGIENIQFDMPDGTQSAGVAGSSIYNSAEFTDEQAAEILGSGTSIRALSAEQDLLAYYTRLSPLEADYYWVYTSLRDENVAFAGIQQITVLALFIMVSVLGLGGLITLFYASRISRPIMQLTARATRMASGEIDVVEEDETIHRQDEIGDLSRSFNVMSRQLRELVSSMEDRVAARTNDLETSAEIAAAVNQVRDLDDLLNLTVNLIRDRFNFYYVQVYILKGKWAELREGTGYVGRKLLSRSHRLPLDGRSLVAEAVLTEAPVVVQDTKTDPNFLPNDLLPNTRSEVAIPLRVQDKIIGVLDIQHEVPNAFEAETIRLFQSMADQLAITFENVSLFQNTEQRALELETVAEVSIEASTNLNTEELLFNVCDLVKDRFKLYHAHIYLMQDDGTRLALAAGAGEVGRSMVNMRRAIALSNKNSLVATAARDRRGVIVNDVAAEPNFLPNPLLPDTHSEMAIPMIVGNKLIGVLDVQADEINHFSESDLKIQTILAAQVAVAVENARSFQETQQARAEADRLFTSSMDLIGSATFEGYFRQLNPAWESALGWTTEELMARPYIEFVHPEDVERTNREANEQLAAGFTTISFENRYLTKDGAYRWLSWNSTPDPEHGLIYFVCRDVTEAKQAQEQIEKRATEMEVVAQVGAAATSTLDIEALLWNVSNLAKESFELYHVHIYLLSDDSKRLILRAGAGEPGRRMVDQGHAIPVTLENSLVARAARTRDGVIVNNITKEPGYLPNPLLPRTRSEMAIPMVVGDTLIGVLDVQAAKVNYFTEEDLAVQSTLASQIAVAVENARAFAEIEKRSRELATVTEVSTQITSILDVEELLHKVAQTTAEGFNLYHIHIYMADESGDNLHLVAGTGEAPCRHVGTGYTINIHDVDTPVTIAARTRKSQVDNNVPPDVNLEINPFLPETRSQMVVPIVLADELLGVLEVHGKLPNMFRDDDVQVQLTLASQIAVAVENARSFQEVQEQQQIVRKRANEMEVVAQVSAAATSTLNIEKLLWDVSNLTKERFDLYHAHIYLLDENKKVLVLAAGAGDAGKTMVNQGHAIPITLENSLVARAARSRSGVIVNDIVREPGFLPNPLLPDTRAEMAIPMVVGDKLVGVLDVQSSQARQFTEQDLSVQSTLASQIAVAVENARSFEAMREARAEADRLFNSSIDLIGTAGFDGYFRQLNPAWSNTLGWTTEELMSRPYVEFVHPEDVERTNEEANEQLAAGFKTVSFENRYITKDGGYRWLSWNSTPDTEHGMIYFVAHDITEEKEAQEIIRKRANEMEVVAQVSAEATRTLDIESLLWRVSDLTKERFDLYHAHIYLIDESGKRLLLAAGAGEAGQIMVDQGHAIPVALENSLVARAARERTGIIVNDITKASGFLPNPLLPDTRSEMAIPMVVGDKLIGILDVQSSRANRFSEEDVRVKSTLASQIAVAVENARSFLAIQAQQEIVRKRATEMEVVAQVGAEVARALDVQSLLWNVCDVTKERFDLYHVQIYLVDRERHRMVLEAAAGELGRTLVQRGHSIGMNRRNSVVVRAALDQVAVVSNDVTGDPSFLPNPMLSDTRSEMAIPIVVGSELLGVLDIQSEDVHYFTEEDVRIQEILADQLGVALENARLYEETLEQAARERETAERLREVDRLKSQFLANMSHELRTPLNSIIGYSEVLLDGVDGELTEDAIEDIEAIYGSGKHLLSIINEILDLAKIEAGEMKLDRQEVNLVESVAELVKSGQVLTKDKPVVLEMVQERELPKVYADPLRLRQILWNLISNAVKFTESGSVRVHLNMTNDKMALITVRDTGIGMTPEDLDLIFQRFSQVDGSSTRRAGGTGLGLTITKQLIEMHGGVINVESEYGVGSTFWFTVPLVISETEEEQV